MLMEEYFGLSTFFGCWPSINFQCGLTSLLCVLASVRLCLALEISSQAVTVRCRLAVSTGKAWHKTAVSKV